MMPHSTAYSRVGGFSLIELAVVLVIIGLLLGGAIAAIDATQTQTRRSQQADQLEDVRDALHGYAMVNGHLPCPDDLDDDTSPDPDGNEDRDPGSDECDSNTGALPWKDLGLGRSDA